MKLTLTGVINRKSQLVHPVIPVASKEDPSAGNMTPSLLPILALASARRFFCKPTPASRFGV